MGDRDRSLTEHHGAGGGEHSRRNRELTVIYAVMACLLFLLVIQFLMLMVSIESFLAGNRSVAAAAALGSGGCFVGACWLIRFVTSVRRVRSA